MSEIIIQNHVYTASSIVLFTSTRARVARLGQ